MDTPLFGDENKKKKNIIFFSVIGITAFFIVIIFIVMIIFFFIWGWPYQWITLAMMFVVLYDCLPLILMGIWIRSDFVDKKLKVILVLCYLGLVLTSLLGIFFIATHDYPGSYCGGVGNELYQAGTGNCHPMSNHMFENMYCTAWRRNPLTNVMESFYGTWNTTGEVFGKKCELSG